MTIRLADVSLRAWSEHEEFAGAFAPLHSFNVTKSKSSSMPKFYGTVKSESISDITHIESFIVSILDVVENNTALLNELKSGEVYTMIWIALFIPVPIDNITLDGTILQKATLAHIDIFGEGYSELSECRSKIMLSPVSCL